MIGKILVRCSVAVVAMQFLLSSARAVDTMADWTGQNNTQPTTPPGTYAQDNNYSIISPTSVGGQIQSKVNFHSPQQFPAENTIDTAFVYLSDPTLDVPGGVLDFTNEMHMSGTISFNSPMATEPNLLFGWYSSIDTRHRVGLGISNRSVAQGGAIADRLRVDFGYAATGGNRFYYVSTDGAQANTEVNSTVPNGTYPFTFDYVPAATGVGGTMSATVGDFFRTVTPMETTPWDLDLFTLDRFGLLQRSTANVTQLGNYNITFSNVTYTGGTAAAVAIPGDFNSSGAADDVDLGIWQTNYGTGTTLATGDADGDGDADGSDFLIWQQNVSGAPEAGAVSEPSALVLLSIAGAAAVVRRRRQQR